MAKETPSNSQYIPSSTTRYLIRHDPMKRANLDAPLLVDPYALGGAHLYVGAVRQNVATIRVPVYPDMQPQDVIQLQWDGKAPYQAQTFVVSADRFVDFTVPKPVLVANIGETCSVTYVVRRNGEEPRRSLTTEIRVFEEFLAPGPVLVHDAPNDELDFSTISPEVGLLVSFPIIEIITGRWLCYGRDGRRKDEVMFAVRSGETIHIWRELLEHVERGGEACIWYTGYTDYIGPSKMTRVRAL